MPDICQRTQHLIYCGDTQSSLCMVMTVNARVAKRQKEWKICTKVSGIINVCFHVFLLLTFNRVAAHQNSLFLGHPLLPRDYSSESHTSMQQHLRREKNIKLAPWDGVAEKTTSVPHLGDRWLLSPSCRDPAGWQPPVPCPCWRRQHSYHFHLNRPTHITGLELFH